MSPQNLKRILFCLFLSGIVLLNQSCISTWMLKKDEVLYKKSKIKFQHDLSYKKVFPVIEDLNNNIFPEDNAKFFGLPTRLWVYQIVGTPKKTKGLRYYLKYGYGEAPVLISSVDINAVSELLLNLLHNNGYFNAELSHTIDTVWWDRKRAKIIYSVKLNQPYEVVSLHYAITDTAINRIVQENQIESFLKVPFTYSLNTLTEEQKRIDELLKQHGFYYFAADFISYNADSTLGNRQIALTMKVSKNVESLYLQKVYLRNITVQGANTDSTKTPTDTINQNTRYIGIEPTYRADRISQYISLKKNALYSVRDNQSTMRNLSALNAFRYTNIDFNPKFQNDTNYVDAEIYLVPNKKYSLFARMRGESKSTDFIGPNAEIGITNRNLLRGAEQLTFKLNGTLEAHIGKDSLGNTLGRFNYETGVSTELEIPRFLFFNQALFSKHYIPQTTISLEYKIINQIKYYQMSIFRANFGYRWNETVNRHHEFNLADISFQHVSNTTSAFDTIRKYNQLLSNSFDDQMIVSSNYTYKYESPLSKKRITYKFTGNIDASGNLLQGLQTLYSKLGGNIRNEGTIFNTTYSQYVRVSIDFRQYWKYVHKNTLAARLFTGMGLPTGNSDILPLIKQYYSGGANSIRAFEARSVGPGSYYEEIISGNVFLGQTGDIKLEANIENRYKIARRYEIAVFADAGNVWLLKNDPLREGGAFRWSTFYNEIAAGAGFGVRYLNDYFIIRLDIGFPLLFPNSLYRTNNGGAVFNIALGYSI